MKNVVEHLRRLVASADGDVSDSQLLSRFLAGQDQAAFASLVRRHGPMVLGVCQRVLRHLHDAEDAFQAAFFILARKASSVAKRASLSSWLYSVAYRAALEAKAAKDRRQAREMPMGNHPHPQVAPIEVQDWRVLLDQELNQLPDKYRAAVILCDLEGRMRKEVARLLGMPHGTVLSRLSTARQMLAKRLAKRGFPLSASLLAVAIADGRAIAEVPLSLALATAKVALQFASGQTAALALPAAALTTGVMKTMFLTKLKMITASVLMVLAVGASGVAYYTTIGAGTALAQDGKGKSELEALRKENDLLRRSLELALDKVRSQETAMRELAAAHNQELTRSKIAQEQAAYNSMVAQTNAQLAAQEKEAKSKAMVQLRGIAADAVAPKNAQAPGSPKEDAVKVRAREALMLADLELSLRTLQDAKDKGATKKALDALENAVKKLKETLGTGEAGADAKKKDVQER